MELDFAQMALEVSHHGYLLVNLVGFEEFTCVMYGRRQFKDFNVLRYMLIKERCGLHDGSINLNKYI